MPSTKTTSSKPKHIQLRDRLAPTPCPSLPASGAGWVWHVLKQQLQVWGSRARRWNILQAPMLKLLLLSSLRWQAPPLRKKIQFCLTTFSTSIQGPLPGCWLVWLMATVSFRIVTSRIRKSLWSPSPCWVSRHSRWYTSGWEPIEILSDSHPEPVEFLSN